MNLPGSVVVVTGASAGVGRATVRAFARAGAHVALIAREEQRLEAAARDVEAIGRRAVIVPCDVAAPHEVEAAAAKIEQELGAIDVWVNNAMVSVLMPFRQTSLEDFERVTRVTYLGYVHGTKAALQRMLPRDRGSIVQVGRRSRTVGSPCRRRTAARSTRSRASPSPSAPS